jgi:hypothetical protein
MPALIGERGLLWWGAHHAFVLGLEMLPWLNCSPLVAIWTGGTSSVLAAIGLSALWGLRCVRKKKCDPAQVLGLRSCELSLSFNHNPVR